MGRERTSDTEPRRGTTRGKRTRRTQEERSAETRARVIQGATECVAELGFAGATMSAISKRAGVTWGAIQHQFGDKDTILDAVLEASLAALEADLAETAASTDATVEARVKAFVDRAASQLRGPGYRAFVEIQLGRGRRRETANQGEASWGEHVAEALERSWRAGFGDLGLPARNVRVAGRFGFMVLSGIAAESMLFPDVDFSKQHLAILHETLIRLLRGD
jgi:AcrR family transcriptional regulator